MIDCTHLVISSYSHYEVSQGLFVTTCLFYLCLVLCSDAAYCILVCVCVCVCVCLACGWPM